MECVGESVAAEDLVAEIQKLATEIYERMDFQWMLNGDPLALSHGWNPEDGFIKSRWARYSEFTIPNAAVVESFQQIFEVGVHPHRCGPSLRCGRSAP
jgi:hypothetical protein